MPQLKLNTAVGWVSDNLPNATLFSVVLKDETQPTI